MQVLQKICWFAILAATSSDQVTLLNSTAADKKLDGLPEYKELLQTFITKEVCVTKQADCWFCTTSSFGTTITGKEMCMIRYVKVPVGDTGLCFCNTYNQVLLPIEIAVYLSCTQKTSVTGSCNGI